MRSKNIRLNTEDKGYASFLIDLKGIELNEEDGSSWVQAMPMGTYQHPYFGKLRFNEKTLNGYLSNWKSNTRGQDLDIDLDHKMFNSEAAGWVSDVKLDLDNADKKQRGLYYKVDWTALGKQKLGEKSYRYFSADYFTEWEDPSGSKHEYVLNGGGLTNRPYIKGMAPVVLSENDDERLFMDREALEKLAKRLGISFTDSTTDADLNALVIAAANEDPDSDSDGDDGDDDGQDDSDADEKDPVLANLSELDKKNPIIAALLSDRAITAQRIAGLETAHKLSEVNRKVVTLGEGKFTVIPKVEAKIKSLLLNDVSLEVGDKILEIIKGIATDGIRQLGEIGGNNGGKSGGSSSTENDFVAQATKLSEELKISNIDAYSKLAEDKPELYEAYVASLTGGSE